MSVIFGIHVKNDNISTRVFHFIKILVLWVVRWVKGQKKPKMTKNSVHHTLYLRNHTSPCTHVKRDNISRCFLYFFQILVFGVNSGVKQ